MKRINEYVRIDGWLDAEVKKECIMHHCRCCQFEWETAPQKPNVPDEPRLRGKKDSL